MFLHTVGGENQMLRRFDFDTISVATENFSAANIISGDNWDGYIYKGKLKNGQDIAIHGPSSHGTHQAYMNQVSILLQVKHENLIQLLGYCIKGTGTYLIYDFAPYATLSSLLFDYPDCAFLGWDERYKIVLGVARALVYLHQHAPIRIIHHYVKPSNILLDEQMNPKLSHFKIAKGYTKSEDDFYTYRIVGTWGYMAPEYALHGHLSTKTDVYSFGVVALETLSGHKVYEYVSGIREKLLEFVWRNWVEGTHSNIIDPRININADPTFMKRLIQIGLLCIQHDAKDRPTMEEVVGVLLGTSSMDLPIPKPVAFHTSDPSDADGSSEEFEG